MTAEQGQPSPSIKRARAKLGTINDAVNDAAFLHLRGRTNAAWKKAERTGNWKPRGERRHK